MYVLSSYTNQLTIAFIEPSPNRAKSLAPARSEAEVTSTCVEFITSEPWFSSINLS